MIRVREQSLCKGKLKARKRENALHKSVVGKPKGWLMNRCTQPQVLRAEDVKGVWRPGTSCRLFGL